MACRSNAIAGPSRAQRLAQALAVRAVEAARLLALVGLATTVLFQPALTQERRDSPAIALQPSPQRSVPGHLQRTIDNLATRAKQAFHARMEPGIPKLILSNIVDARRDLFSVLRDYVRSNFDTAVDALVTDATTDVRARAVEHALRTFVEAGQTFASDALFAEMIERSGADARAQSAALRYSVALAELPAALAKLNEAPFVAPFGLTGDKALPAFRRAADLDPDDTWTWIVVALKSPGPDDMDQALLKAGRAAQAQGDWGGLAFTLQVAGLALEVRGRPTDADRAYADAVQAARIRSAAAPSDVEAARQLARNLLWLGSVTVRRNGEVAPARTALEEALQLREAAALRQPDGMRETVDLISCHLQLNMLFHQNGFGAEAKDHLDAALRLYGAMADRSQFAPTLAIDGGLTSEALLIAGVLTLVAGFILLALYRRRMRALMRATAKAPVALQPESSSANQFPGADAHAIPIRFESAAPSASSLRSGALAHAAIAMRRASWVQALAGGAFAAVASILMFRLGDIEFSYVRSAIFLLAWGWPIVLVLYLLWGQDRRWLGVLLVGYFGVLAGVCLIVALGDTAPLEVGGISIAPFFVPLIFWGAAILPALFLVFFLLRGIRAVGPVLLVFMIVAMCGAAAGVIALSTMAGMKVVVAILAPLGVFSPWIAVLLAAVAGMVLLVPFGWIAVDFIRRGYEARYFSDTSIVFDSIWLFQTLSLFRMLYHSAGRAAWVALGAFVIYRLIVWLGLRPVAAAAKLRPPARLLLLRVFGFKRRTERLFDLLSARWRYAGPIALIAAPDLASRSIDPVKLLAFVSGRLKRRFIIEPADFDRRVDAVDDRADADGSYRVDELFCGKDAWQAAVLSLMGNCDLVAMDLRGFSPNNKGCVFELQSLVAHVPLGKIMLLIDATTDVGFLRHTLDTCWGVMESRSVRAGEAGALILLDTRERDPLAVDRLMALADQALGQTASLPPPIGTASLARA
jgi:tetratricopeptide (TPR) repeat protein